MLKHMYAYTHLSPVPACQNRINLFGSQMENQVEWEWDHDGGKKLLQKKHIEKEWYEGKWQIFSKQDDELEQEEGKKIIETKFFFLLFFHRYVSFLFLTVDWYVHHLDTYLQYTRIYLYLRAL